ncbi:MAG: 30S ribosomal protein S16 [Candidatus Muiribacterium halophilum]|uniref:Small ribosomal subunit protein bS16 n=1 Tax=Muiribacterium halophilum TaxID=2053465 RepID=A0A2N5ZIM8_MUIH1|nr:MAG: 30S ribosomal protein S16 [Candidatus Muirbacterium halophilum]
MPVKMRLKRLGTKKRPCYRIVVADVRSPRDGQVVEEVGLYQPLTDPATIEINEEAAIKHIMNGVMPTQTVKGLLKKKGILAKIHELKSKKK